MILRKAAPVGAALCLVAFASPAASAADRAIQGRTGLPTVRVGGEKVWMERGNVLLNSTGGRLVVNQTFRLRYPGAPLEKRGLVARIATREDFYRSIANGAPKVNPANARGFSRFAVYVDGRRVRDRATSWLVNDKKDTATRWREWNVAFRTNQIHTLRIVSEAPLGWYDNHRWVSFVSKDLGHWRTPPDFLDIRLQAPGNVGAQMVEYQPKPDEMSRRTVSWIYRKAVPSRDVFVLLPTSFAHRSGM